MANADAGVRAEAEPARVAVIRAGALGDVLLGLPALRALRRIVPAARITLVAPAPQVHIATWDATADEVVAFDEPSLAPLIAGEATSLPDALRGVDGAVVWMRRHAEVAACLRALGVRVIASGAPFPPPGVRVHASDWLVESIVGAIGPVTSPSPAAEPWQLSATVGLTPPADAQARINVRLADVGLGNGPYVVLHPGSGSRRKNWPVAAWIDVAGPLARERPVVVVAGPAEQEILVDFQRAWQASWGTLPAILECLSLAEVAALLAGAALYLGNDSGVSHLAAAVGARCAVVFGPTNPAVWRPRGPHVTVLGGATPSADSLFAEEPAWPSVEAVRQAVDGWLRR
ncbi:MAG: hypothetical protein AVDCRST_MAG77-4354 [uncultured Chloroflexi bacterium]|uniref:ADP-heptose--lipooligosaccharide heptosyltransferase II n=1 Tax=uncultured Chloroflexota bacterium TaxID=166587 RepID=A0A6J4JT32_9CHLR|nr:MAG: hypothetical protein AVDCRST_MAG77-4354 [uncultured Chloroflexota bacterium]